MLPSLAAFEAAQFSPSGKAATKKNEQYAQR
jgi:hypothetical protein